MSFAQLLRRYFYSHYVHSGLRVALGVLGLTLVAWATLGPQAAAAVSSGALGTSLTDLPGPLAEKRRIMPAAVVLGTLATLGVGLSAGVPWLNAALVLGITFVSALLLGWGRAALPLSVGTLFVTAMALGSPEAAAEPWRHAGGFLAGAGGYLLWGLVAARVTARRTRQQALAESLHELAEYLRDKAACYVPGADLERCYAQLVRRQTLLVERQQAARDLVLEELRTPADGTLLATLLAAFDIYEAVLSAHTDHALLQRTLAGGDALDFLHELVLKAARALDTVAAALMRDQPPPATLASFKPERFALAWESQRLAALPSTPDTEAARAALAATVAKIERCVQRIAELPAIVQRPVPPAELLGGGDFAAFRSPPLAGLRMILAQAAAPNSPLLRHAVRLCAAIGAALVLGHVLPYEAHGYWIVLTIALVLRPNFSITQQRQKDRLLGNLAGCVLAAALLATQPPAVLLLAAIFVANTVAHAFVTLRYRYTATAGCVIVLLQIHLTGGVSGEVAMVARVFDTVLGGGLSIAASHLLPSWERYAMPTLLRGLLTAAAAHARATLAEPACELDYRLARKRYHDAVVALAGAFERMLAEPPDQQRAVAALERYVALGYLLGTQLVALHMLRLHRGSEFEADAPERLRACAAAVEASLATAAHAIDPQQPLPPEQPPPAVALADTLADDALPGDWHAERLLVRRLALIRASAGELRERAVLLAAAGWNHAQMPPHRQRLNY